MENQEINGKILKIWKEYPDKSERYPLLYPDLEKDSILFIGVNPSFSDKDPDPNNSFKFPNKDFDPEKAIKDHKVRQGYIDPKDFLLKFNKYNNSIYLSIYNRKTSENHDLVYVNSKTNLGSFNHRFSSIKDESQFIIYNKTKGLGNIADKISEKWGELRFILTDAF